MKKILKSNMKAIIAFVVGLVIAGTVGIIYAASVASSDVTYDNTDSGSSATTVKAALDDLYIKAEQANDWKWKIDSIRNSNITLNVSHANTLHFDKIFSTGCWDFGDGTGCWPGQIVISAKTENDANYTVLIRIQQATHTDYSVDVSAYDYVQITEAQHQHHRLSQTGADGITAY